MPDLYFQYTQSEPTASRYHAKCQGVHTLEQILRDTYTSPTPQTTVRDLADRAYARSHAISHYQSYRTLTPNPSISPPPYSSTPTPILIRFHSSTSMFTFSNYPPHLPPFHLIHLLYHLNPHPSPIPPCDLARPRATSHDLSFVNYTNIPMITLDIHPRSPSQTRGADLGAISADNPHPHLLHHDKPSPITHPLGATLRDLVRPPTTSVSSITPTYR